jgi:hypothetical protein
MNKQALETLEALHKDMGKQIETLLQDIKRSVPLSPELKEFLTEWAAGRTPVAPIDDQPPTYSKEFLLQVRELALHESSEVRFITPISAGLISNMRSSISKGCSFTPTHILAGNDFFKLMFSEYTLSKLFDPITRYTDVISGYLGTLIGLDVLIDSYDSPEKRILPNGFLAVVSIETYKNDDGSIYLKMHRCVNALIS